MWLDQDWIKKNLAYNKGVFLGNLSGFAQAAVEYTAAAATFTGGNAISFAASPFTGGASLSLSPASTALAAVEVTHATGVLAATIQSMKSGSNYSSNSGVGNPVKTAGRGSTGRTEPKSIEEQMAMHETKSDPLKNATELPLKMNDARWHAKEGWVKMQKNVKLSNGKTVSIHYVYNKVTGVFDDFKFK